MKFEKINAKDFVKFVKEGIESGAEVSIESSLEDIYNNIIDISLVYENIILFAIENDEGKVEEKRIKLKSVETANYNDFCDSFDIISEDGKNYVINICE